MYLHLMGRLVQADGYDGELSPAHAKYGVEVA
jgi:hypothetical protein